MSSAPKVSFILVNYFSQEHTIRCVESIVRESKDLDYEIILVDNNSDIQPAAFTAKFPMVSVTRNARNLGYGLGCDTGAQRAMGTYLFFINNDATLLNNAGQILADYLDHHPDVALVGPQLIDPQGKRIPSFDYFPTLTSKLIGTSVLRFFSPARYPRKDSVNACAVDLVAGATLFVRSDVYHAVGGFDKLFFLYCEEEDLALRIKNAGHAVHFVPHARVMHASGGSAKNPAALKKEFYISFFAFYRKHYGEAKTACIKTLCLGQFLWRYLVKTDRELWASLIQWLFRGAPAGESLRYGPGNIDDVTQEGSH